MRRAIGSIVVSVLLFASSEALAQKVDLSSLLGNIPSVGDSRTYTISTGGMQVLEIVQVQFVGKAWRIVALSQATGSPDALVETFIVPGKQTLLGNSESAALSVLVRKPKRLQRFVFKIGKAQRAVVKAFAFSGSNPIGPAVWAVESEFLGFEAFDTGIDLFPETARLRQSLGLSVLDVLTGDQVVAVSTQSSWIAPGLGLVASQRRIVTYLNGFQQSDTGTQTYTLTSAVVGGVPYP